MSGTWTKQPSQWVLWMVLHIYHKKGHGSPGKAIHKHILNIFPLSEDVVAVTIGSLLLVELSSAVRVMLHLLPGGMLEIVAEVLELVAVMDGVCSGSPQSSVQ